MSKEEVIKIDAIKKLLSPDGRGIMILCDENNKGAMINTFNLDVNNILHLLLAVIADITIKEKDNIELDKIKALLLGIMQLMDNKKGD